MKTTIEILNHLEQLRKQLVKDKKIHEETIYKQYHAPNLETELDLLTLTRRQKRELGKLEAQIKVLEWIVE